MRTLSIALLLLSVCAVRAATNCPVPKPLYFHVEKEVRRDTLGFTEGLEVHDEALYESTGDLFGDTRINRIDPASGHVRAVMNAGKRYFGEGLTFWDDKIYQMSWREHRVFVMDAKGRVLREMSNPREGWGLTHDAANLIASDGSSRIFFLSPQDFSTLRELDVSANGMPVPNINELEYVQGAIWANVFEDWRLIRISPRTGCVEAIVDLTPLRERFNPADRGYIESDANFVPNGIAYDPAGGLFTLTGKYWPILFSGRFSPVP
jgi:glutamine cyclotransferase